MASKVQPAWQWNTTGAVSPTRNARVRDFQFRLPCTRHTERNQPLFASLASRKLNSSETVGSVWSSAHSFELKERLARGQQAD